MLSAKCVVRMLVDCKSADLQVQMQMLLHGWAGEMVAASTVQSLRLQSVILKVDWLGGVVAAVEAV